MPGSVFADSKRQRFWDSVLELCREITHANGYTTQPFVTNDPREAQSSEEEFSLLVMEGGESTIGVGVGGCHELVITIDILGYALSKDYQPTIGLNMLIQDVRNALGTKTNLGRLAETVGCGTQLVFGDLETDSGILTMDGVAAFLLPANYTYKDGPNW